MKKSLLAGAAMVAAVAIGSPILAWSADDTSPSAAAAPASSSPAPDADAGWHHHHGDGDGDHGMRHHPGMRAGMMAGMWHWMHGAHHMTPQQRCEDRLARRAGIRAYIVAKLQLTAEQKPLLDKLAAAQQSGDQKETQYCATLKPRDQRENETLLDKMNHREQFLSTRLQALQQEQPALQALYQALTPAQKAIVDHPFHHS